METTILASIITGSLAIIAAILVGYKEELRAIFSRSNRNISGWWVGESEDLDEPKHLGANGENLKYKIKIKINQKGKRITAKAIITTDITVGLNYKGMFINDDYLYLKWDYDDKDIKGFGMAVLQVMGIGKIIKGAALFTRIRADGIALLSINLYKVD